MKKYIFAALAIFIFTMSNVQATGLASNKKKKDEYKDAPRMVFTSYPIAFFGSAIKAGYEFYIPDNKSFNFVVSYAGTGYSNIYDVSNLSIFQMEAQFRFYLNKLGNNAPLNGFYLSPFLLYGAAAYTNDPHINGTNYHASSFGIGYYIGFQHIFPAGLSIGFYGGGAIMNPSGTYQPLDMDVNPFSKGVKPRGSITFGIAF